MIFFLILTFCILFISLRYKQVFKYFSQQFFDFSIIKRSLERNKNHENESMDDGSDSFKLRIPRMRYNKHTGAVQYNIIVRYNGVVWDTWRRYSEFLTLRQRHSFKSSFPRKSSFTEIMAGSDYTLQFIDKRRKELELFLNSAIGDEKAFAACVCYLKADNKRIGPSGEFFAVPLSISFENISLEPTKVELLRHGIKAFE